jgi:RND family efflux transporter MFP subunit
MKKSVLIVIMLAVIALIAVGIGIRYMQNKKVAAPVINAAQVSVTVETLARAPMKEVLAYTGALAADNQVTVVSQTSGTVEKVKLEVGRKCKQGDTLAVVNNEMQHAALEQAQAQVLAAQANYDKALKDLKRTQSLAAENAVSQVNLENAQLGADAALAQLKAAQAGRTLASKQYNDTYLRTPISGRIATKRIDKGATVAPGSEIAEVVDDSRFKVTVMVSEMDINKMETGRPAAVTVDAVPGKEFSGIIASIGSVPSHQGRLYPVEVSIDGSHAEGLKTGMFCRANVTIQTVDGAFSVAAGAVATDPNGGTYVYTVENGKAAKKPARLGFKYAERYQLISGLNEGAVVIVTGRERVNEGTSVATSKGDR